MINSHIGKRIFTKEKQQHLTKIIAFLTPKNQNSSLKKYGKQLTINKQVQKKLHKKTRCKLHPQALNM
jgi:hypothetical protein